MANWTPPQNEPDLLRSQRRARGVYYTPAEIVRFLCQRMLGPLLQVRSGGQEPIRVIDPACGAGAFLVEAARMLFEQKPAPVEQLAEPAAVAWRLAAARRSLFGIDIDPVAVAQCRRQLARAIVGHDGDSAELESVAAELASNIVQADALLDDLPPQLPAGSFDLVLGNPPYVNIRQLVKQQGADYVRRVRDRFATATGNFDLYVPFVERAYELLRDGGRCAFIVPNKIAGLGYAAQCRLMLLEQTQLDLLADLSASRVFSAAGVYPWMVAWTKAKPTPAHKLHWITATTADDLTAPTIAELEQSTLQADGFRRRCPTFTTTSNNHCQPLASLATLQCGTAGYAAMRIAERIREAGEEHCSEQAASNSRRVDFIVSGNIDRYRIEPGNVRYLGLRFRRPQLSLDDPTLTARQRRLFAQPKIVLGGMTRRLEAAYDGGGLALGVQVYAVLPAADELYYLLGLLNSRWLSYWFRQQFAAKQLASGYLGINKAQLAQLPIRMVDPSERADVRRRRAIAEAAEALSASCSLVSPIAVELDRRIDQLVYELYGLSDGQIAQCESHFSEPHRRAA